MDLVTGHAGAEHISAADVACMLRCMYGEQDGVYAVDGQLACTVQSANLVEIATGALSVQGYFARIDIAEQLTVDSGTPGYRRNDLVVARYELGEGNVQSMTLAVVKGTPTTQGEATDPSLTEGDIDGGDVLAEFALWRIPIDGVNVGDPVRVLPLLTPFLAKASAQDDAIQALRDSVDVTLINISQDVACKTELFDTGVRVTIPANSIFCVCAHGEWRNGNATHMAIAVGGSTHMGFRRADADGSVATYGGYMPNTNTLAVLAKYANATENTIYVYGWYRTLS